MYLVDVNPGTPAAGSGLVFYSKTIYVMLCGRIHTDSYAEVRMTQLSGTVRLRMLVTAKAAPNPSERYGETVCVSGLSTDPERPGWVRLYPINYHDLGSND